MSNLRHRDLLLSLKYSTVEACFSVPMLNLTMPSFTFVVAFAVQGLGWGNVAVGFMTALPHLCNFVQPVLMTRLAQRFTTYQLLILSFLGNALPWLFTGLMLSFSGSQNTIFTAVLMTSTLCNSLAAVSWSSAISELVPPHISGRFFGRRNLIFGIWTLIVVFAVGHVVGRADNAMTAFCIVFMLAGVARLIGLLFLTRMKFPPVVMEKQTQGLTWADIRAVFSNKNYLRLVLFIGAWNLLINASQPFFTVYLVDRLGFGVGDVVRLTTLSSLGGLVTLRGWGRLADQFGNRPVIHVCALIWTGTLLAMWTFAGPHWHWHLNVGYFLVGAVTAGFQLAQFNLMLKLAPAKERPAHVAMFLSMTSLLTAIGPLAASQLLVFLPDAAGQLFGQPITQFHLLFILAGVGCLVVTSLAARINEPAQQSLENVWSAMRGMKSFNPMLSVMSVGELLLTPRSFLALGRRSFHSARRQVRALGDVGEEIVEGGRDVVRKRFGERD